VLIGSGQAISAARYGLHGQVLNRRVAEVLDLIGLSERCRDRVESFSGGMKRRLNIGAGLVRPGRHHRPRPVGC
jgi:ABC-type multidrug transport system ATPase subunit